MSEEFRNEKSNIYRSVIELLFLEEKSGREIKEHLYAVYDDTSISSKAKMREKVEAYLA